MIKADSHLQTEGIVLQTIPFKDFDAILTLFTEQEGILKLFVKGAKRPALHLQALTSPFTVAEYIYLQGNSSLHRFHEGKILQQNLWLRETLSGFEVASHLVQALLKSQWQGKASSALYRLFRLFLEKIPQLESPEKLLPIFFLKILKNEGLLHIRPVCNICNIPLKEAFRQLGECFCPIHAPKEALLFSEEEQLQLRLLSQSRSFQEILTQDVSALFSQKITTLFSQVFDHS